MRLHGSSERGFCFFFQAEDGIRDVAVTGVQTCALPISAGTRNRELRTRCPRQKIVRQLPALPCRDKAIPKAENRLCRTTRKIEDPMTLRHPACHGAISSHSRLD